MQHGQEKSCIISELQNKQNTKVKLLATSEHLVAEKTDAVAGLQQEKYKLLERLQDKNQLYLEQSEVISGLENEMQRIANDRDIFKRTAAENANALEQLQQDFNGLHDQLRAYQQAGKAKASEHTDLKRQYSELALQLQVSQKDGKAKTEELGIKIQEFCKERSAEIAKMKIDHETFISDSVDSEKMKSQAALLDLQRIHDATAANRKAEADLALTDLMHNHKMESQEAELSVLHQAQQIKDFQGENAHLARGRETHVASIAYIKARAEGLQSVIVNLQAEKEDANDKTKRVQELYVQSEHAKGRDYRASA